MSTFRVKPLVLAIAMASGYAYAQEDSAGHSVDDFEEIVVMGNRQRFADQLNFKRDAVGQLDTILSEDIGKFPDANIGDALKRVPGITITRDGGEGRNVQVRGLGPEFTRVTINGMESSSAGDGLGGGSVSNNRQFDFNVFASELFTRVDVQKTQQAVEESGISGHINMSTARPLDYNGLKVAYSAQMATNELTGDETPRGSFLISNTFADDSIGVLFSTAVSETKVRQEGHTTVRWQNTSAITSATGTGLNTVFHPRIPRASSRHFDQTRTGSTFGLQFRPQDGLELSLNVLTAELDTTRNEYEFSAAMQTNSSSIVAEQTVVDRQLDSFGEPVGEIVAGTFSNVRLRSEAVKEESSQDFFQGTLDVDWQINEDLNLSVLAGRSLNTYSRPIERTMAVDANNTTFSYSYVNSINSVDAIAAANGSEASRNRDVPYLWFDTNPAEAGMQITDSDDYVAGLIRSRSNDIENENSVLKLDFEYILSDTQVLKFGFEDRMVDTFYTDRRNDAGRDSQIPGDGSATALTVVGPIGGFGDGLEGFSGNFPSDETWLSPSYAAFVNSFFVDGFGNPIDRPPVLDGSPSVDTDGDDIPDAYGVSDIDYNATLPTAIGTRSYGIKEESTSAYVQYEFETEVADMTLRGNLGLRYIETTTIAKQFLKTAFDDVNAQYEQELLAALVAGSPYPNARPDQLDYFSELEGDYSNLLPSLNLSLNISDDLVARFSAAQAITRAPISNLASSVNVDVFGFGVNSGNPSLEPFQTDQLDLGLEWYFAEESLLSAAIFWKKFTTDIVSSTVSRPLTNAEIQAFDLQAAIDEGRFTTSTNFDITSRGNDDGEDYTGFEVSYQQPFAFLPEPMDGLGAILNFTSLDVETEYSFSGETLKGDRTDISSTSLNGTIYYDREKWGVRLSYNWRDEYLDTTGSRNGNDSEGYDAIGQLDISARYELMDNLILSFEGINLTDEHTLKWTDRANKRPVDFLHTGTTFLIGLRGSF